LESFLHIKIQNTYHPFNHTALEYLRAQRINIMKILYTIFYFITLCFSQAIFTSEQSYAVHKCSKAICRTVKINQLPNTTRSFDYGQLTSDEKLIIDANIEKRKAAIIRAQNELSRICKNKKEIEKEKYMVIAKPS
jgi:hypothetical protein